MSLKKLALDKPLSDEQLEEARERLIAYVRALPEEAQERVLAQECWSIGFPALETRDGRVARCLIGAVYDYVPGPTACTSQPLTLDVYAVLAPSTAAHYFDLLAQCFTPATVGAFLKDAIRSVK